MPTEMTDLRDAVLEKILVADRRSACDLIQGWAKVQDNTQPVVELLESVLTQVGKLWDKGAGVSLAHGYVAAKVAEDVLENIAASKPGGAAALASKGPVVLGNAEDDCHALGRKLVGTFLRTAGWKVIDLGNDVPAVDFVDKAIQVGAKVIGVSAMMYTNALNIVKVRKEIDRRGLAGCLQLAVGGAVFAFRPELVEEVGGDGTARNALGAPPLMEELWQRATPERNKR